MIDFMGIGGQRCGTTWLYRNLELHSRVAFPLGKEHHYWDYEEEPNATDWLELYPRAVGKVRQGEITPSYAILSDERVRQIADVAPDLRLLLVVRNPMERSWSAATRWLIHCQMEPHEASDAWFVDVVRSAVCRDKSTFSRTIATWREMFSVEQLHIINHDDIETDPVSVLKAVATHIGVNPAFYDTPRASVTRVIGESTSPVSPPSRHVLEVLQELHADEIDRLAPVLGRDLAHWHAWTGA